MIFLFLYDMLLYILFLNITTIWSENKNHLVIAITLTLLEKSNMRYNIYFSLSLIPLMLVYAKPIKIWHYFLFRKSLNYKWTLNFSVNVNVYEKYVRPQQLFDRKKAYICKSTWKMYTYMTKTDKKLFKFRFVCVHALKFNGRTAIVE